MMDGLIKDFGESLSNNMVPALSDFLENEIDSLIQNNTLKNVPILGTIAGAIRVGKDLRERNLLRQTAVFLFEFNSGAIDEEKLRKYKEKIKNDKEKQEELARVLLILNNNVDLEKSKIISKLFTAHVNEEISQDIFYEYIDITNRLFMEDFRLLKALWGNISYVRKLGDNFRAERIYSVGIINNKNIAITGEPQDLDGRCLSVLGKEYCDIIFTDETKMNFNEDAFEQIDI